MRIAILQYGLMMKIKNIFQRGSKMPSVEALVPTKLYRSIHELPLSLFIDCFCDGKFDSLIINGQPTELELNEVWADILQQYTELIGGSDVRSKIHNIKQIARLESKLLRIESLLRIVQLRPSKDLFEQLYSFGYSLPKKEYSIENLHAIVTIFIGYFKKERTKYKLLTAGFTEAKTEVSKTDRNDFSKNLGRVSIAFKMPPISINNITTAQYCNYMMEYADYCDNLEKQNQKK